MNDGKETSDVQTRLLGLAVLLMVGALVLKAVQHGGVLAPDSVMGAAVRVMSDALGLSGIVILVLAGSGIVPLR